MKRVLCCVFLLMILCTGCGNSPSAYLSGRTQTADQNSAASSDTGDVPSEVIEAKKHMLTVWADLLAARDTLYKTQLWAYDRVDVFLETRDWDELSKARTACIAAAASLREQENAALSLSDLSDGEYDALFSAGMDIEYQSLELERCSSDIQTARESIRDIFLAELEASGPFSAGLLSILGDEAALARRELDCYAVYDCLMTNYLLLSLDLPEEAERFWDAMPEQYPSLCLGRGEWLRNSGDIELRAQEDLDRLEDLETDRSKILSKEKALYDSMTDGQPAADAVALRHAPALLPAPVWYDPDEAIFRLVDENGGSVPLPEAGSEPEPYTRSVLLRLEQVTEREVEQYLEALSAASVRVRREDGGDSLILTEEYQVRVSVNDGGVSVLFRNQDVTFAPDWYIRAASQSD